MPQITDHFEAVANAGHRAVQTGTITSVVGWFTSSEAGVVVGILIGITGLAVQWYYRKKQDRRQEEEHRLRIAQIARGEL